MLEDSNLDKTRFLPNPAMGAADQILQWGDLSRLRLLWGSKIGLQIRNMDFFRLVIKQWSRSPFDKRRLDWDVVFGLIDDVFDKMVKERWGNELLSMAARTGCMPVIRRLMDRAQHQAGLRTELLDGSPLENSSIGAAVLGNHVDVVEYLLGQQGIEGHLQHRNSHGENVLHLASRLCNHAIFRHLVPRLKEGVYQTDEQNDTVLIRIIMSSSASRDRYESARILLSEVGAGEDGRFGDEQQEALRVATRLGDLDMCRLLIDFGTNPLLQVHPREEDHRL